MCFADDQRFSASDQVARAYPANAGSNEIEMKEYVNMAHCGLLTKQFVTTPVPTDYSGSSVHRHYT